jgi:transposase
LLEAGKNPKEAAKILKVTPRCVNRWRQEAKTPKRKKATRPPGRPPKLSKQQLQRLEKALDQGASPLDMEAVTGHWIG